MSVFTKKNLNLLFGLLTLLVVLWISMSVVPGVFNHLFDTTLGNLIIVITLILALIHNLKLGIGLSVVLMILYRYGRMTSMEYLIL